MKKNAISATFNKRLGFAPLWACNQKCSFCAKGSPPPGVKASLSTAEALAVLSKARREGYDFLSIDGGEPTLRRDLPELVSAAARMGYGMLAITTNAVALADGKMVNEFLRRLNPPGCLGFCVSLHSHLAGVSEKLTRAPGTFEKTLSGVRAIDRAGFNFSFYFVITTLNFRSIPRYADFIIKNFPRANAVTFSYIFPSSNLGAEALDLYPRISPTSPYLAKAAGILEAAGINTFLGSCGVVPLCLMRGTEQLFLDTSKMAGSEFMTFDTQRMAPFPFFDNAFNRQNRTKGPACAKCFINRACNGVWNFYAEKFGFSELRPFTGAYFRRLPRAPGTAALDLTGCLKSPDPETLAMINVIDLRYRGFSSLRLVNADALGGGGWRLAAFARKAGFKIIH
ncbi:MAG: hypothetical protein A2X34_07940 [Elusimicrobia bacterium GWC2_51_8]|nr:MAG: hypothetical protein A2X33_06685 [Elusimicrobia bacterium GWA2_51_34]OGR60224.1 MAG: hypothetical protein A2X34_07940 [Elusimicrobia bacterium GWC2_51_8]OGR88668.1 MAG: hypothetical protein A2021_06455 [Elusimicrobia bacterium GWF2_52_66]HAF96677.1 hypothetical protein [Elusimicrobiota bacterium]HCE96878.1 hypothetical protein [Elusimicrobiota bacterium]